MSVREKAKLLYVVHGEAKAGVAAATFADVIKKGKESLGILTSDEVDVSLEGAVLNVSDSELFDALPQLSVLTFKVLSSTEKKATNDTDTVLSSTEKKATNDTDTVLSSTENSATNDTDTVLSSTENSATNDTDTGDGDEKLIVGGRVIPPASRRLFESVLLKLSDDVRSLLKSGKGSLHFNRVISEIGYAVLQASEFRSKTDYDLFGRFMIHQYPDLDMSADGKTKWHFFNSKLSQKVRHIRNPPKKRTKENRKETSKAVAALTSTSVDADSADSASPCLTPAKKRKISPENLGDGLACISEILEAKGGKVDLARVKKTMRQTHVARRVKIQSSSDGLLDFPFLKRQDLMLAEFQSHKSYVQYPEFRLNLLNALMMVKRFKQGAACDDSVEFHASETAEMLAFVRKKTQLPNLTKSESIIKIVKTGEAVDLGTPAPTLFTGEDSWNGIVVYKDHKIKCQSSEGLIGNVYTLMAVYFVLDLEYPPANRNLLGFVQEYGLRDKSVFKRSTGYTKLSVQLNAMMKERH